MEDVCHEEGDEYSIYILLSAQEESSVTIQPISRERLGPEMTGEVT